ncbi:hypothetical protein D3C80_1271380 [compost metagenome]
MVSDKGQAEHRLGDGCPHPQPVRPHLKTLWCALHVHRPDKREQGEGHPAKRIHQRFGLRQQQGIDVVDQHGDEGQHFDHVECGRTEALCCVNPMKDVGNRKAHAVYSPDDTHSTASAEHHSRTPCRSAMSPLLLFFPESCALQILIYPE